MAAFFLLTFFMESYLLRFKRQWLGWLKSTPSVPPAYPKRTPSVPQAYPQAATECTLPSVCQLS